MQQRRYAPIAISPNLEGERDAVCGQSRFVIWRPGDLTLRRTMSAEHAAAKRSDTERLPCALNAGATAGGV
jgi:hypothetical protein